MAAELTANASKAGTDFNAVTFARLAADFEALSPAAASILSNFEAAAEKAGLGKRAFNASAQRAAAPKPAKQSLLTRLRTSEELIALRQLAAAREEMLEVNGDLGAKIAKHVEKGFTRKR